MTPERIRWIDDRIKEGYEVTICEGPLTTYYAHLPWERDAVIKRHYERKVT